MDAWDRELLLVLGSVVALWTEHCILREHFIFSEGLQQGLLILKVSGYSVSLAVPTVEVAEKLRKHDV